jgi:hypothetical protein
MSNPLPLPNWIKKSGGRLERFDGDRISRAIFAASQATGRPDPFLARELTDGVLHLLAADPTADPIPVGDVIDATIKFVRELGHPGIARALQDLQAIDSDDPVARGLMPPDLEAADREGLLRLFAAAPPPKFAGMVLPPNGHVPAAGWIAAVAAAGDRVSHYVAIDGPDYLLQSPPAAVEWAAALRRAVHARGLRAFVNLNVAEPPAWANTEGGPLFGRPRLEDPPQRRELAEVVAHELLDVAEGGIRVDWHLAEEDFDLQRRARLIRLGQYVTAGAPLAFVVDRPRRPVALGEGLDRDNPAVLAAVGVGLPRLMDIVSKRTRPTTETLLSKVGTLAELALSAGRIHRVLLRRQAAIGIDSGFLLDRARLLVIPVGLEHVVQSMTGQHWTTTAGMEFARDILLGLKAALLRDAARMPAIIGWQPSIPEFAAGLENVDVPPRQQLRAASTLQTALGSGTAVISLPSGTPARPEEIADLVVFAGLQPGIERFMFRARTPRLRQMTAGW